MASQWYYGPAKRRSVVKQLLTQLVLKDRITTTLALARTVKPSADRLMSLIKRNDVKSAKELIAMHAITIPKLTDAMTKRYKLRNGGFTRILKTGYGDGNKAPRAMLEFVDAPGDFREWSARQLLLNKNGTEVEVESQVDEAANDTDRPLPLNKAIFWDPGSIRRTKGVDPLNPIRMPSMNPEFAKNVSLHQLLSQHGPIAFFDPYKTHQTQQLPNTKAQRAIEHAATFIAKTEKLKNRKFNEEKWPPQGKKVILRHRLVWHLQRDWDEIKNRLFKIAQLERRARRDAAKEMDQWLNEIDDAIQVPELSYQDQPLITQEFKEFNTKGDQNLRKIRQLEEAAKLRIGVPEIPLGYDESALSPSELTTLQKIEAQTNAFWGKADSVKHKLTGLKSAIPEKITANSPGHGPRPEPPHPCTVMDLAMIPPYLRSPQLNALMEELVSHPEWVIPATIFAKRVWLREYGLVPDVPQPYMDMKTRAKIYEGAELNKYNRKLGLFSYKAPTFRHPAKYAREEGLMEEIY